MLSGITPSDARLGRWILLYGILQSLSTISVDTAGLKYKDKIKYYISPSLEGCPPWRSPDAGLLMIEACQERSYCWVAPKTWADLKTTPPAYSNHQYELDDPHSIPTELEGRVVQRSRSRLEPPTNRTPTLANAPQLQGDLKPNVPLKSSRRVSPAPSSAGASYTSSSKRFVASNVEDGYFSEARSQVSQ